MKTRIATAIAIAATGILALAGPNARAALVAHYSFESDALTDETGNNNGNSANGTVDLVTSTAPVPGGSSQAVRFNLNNSGTIVEDVSYIDLPEGDAAEPDTDLFIDGSYTIATWLNVVQRSGDGTTSGAAAGIVGNYAAGSPYNHNYLLRVFTEDHPNANKIGFIARDDSGDTVSLQDSTAPTLNTWYHYAVTFNSTDGSTIMYRDGVQVATDTLENFDGFDSSGLAAVLGYDDDPLTASDNGFNGLLDDVRIYDEALSQSEIQALTIPEPSALALLLLGGVAALGRRRVRGRA